ncbi:tetratricopeptide repeat protein [Plantactinospora solaniradicis]|uniref:Tetratricopeptide repeat protein n=1 Tax=Plantactinospora solaniradicis TaxID=1723736 RepID=A0ABW1KNW7_9ACTN
MREIIQRRQQAGFVGRDGQVAQFRENLGLAVTDARRRFVFNVHGDAGVGKTFLVQQLRRVAGEQAALTAYTNEDAFDVPDTMAAIAANLADQGARLKEFEKRYATYQQRRRELEADPQAPEGASAFLTRTAVKIGLGAARQVPVAGAVVDAIDANALAEQADRVRVFLSTKFHGHDKDIHLLLSPSEELTPVFVEGLREVARNQPLALFLDTFERTAPLLDGWLLDLLGARYGELPANLVVTVAGQRPLDPNRWAAYLDVIADIPLVPFTEVEVRQLLSHKGVTDDRVIRVILELSGRLPLLVAMLAENRPADSAEVGDPSGNAVERFLKWEDDQSRRNAALAGALPRRVNQDILAVATKAEDPSMLYSWLRGQPFVTHNAGVCHYHDIVRASMIRLQRGQSPSIWREQHTKLAAQYRAWRKELALKDDDGWKNATWQEYILEETYHELCANPAAALPTALENAVFAARAGATMARRWAEMLRQAGQDVNNPAVQRWGGRLYTNIDDADSGRIGFLTALLQEADLAMATRTIALATRGRQYRRGRKYEQALADFNRIIELSPDRDWPIVDRAETYQLMGRYEEALADFGRALEADPGSVPALTGRGKTYRMMGRYEKALADLNRALELEPESHVLYEYRGHTHMAMKWYEQALADLNHSLELLPDCHAAYERRAETYRLMKRHEEALIDFKRALENDPKCLYSLSHRGLTYDAMGRYEEALDDFNEALRIDPENHHLYERRGEAYMSMERYEEALDDFNRSLELDPKCHGAHERRAAVYMLMERYEDALTDLNRALELSPGCQLAITQRDLVLQMLEP